MKPRSSRKRILWNLFVAFVAFGPMAGFWWFLHPTNIIDFKLRERTLVRIVERVRKGGDWPRSMASQGKTIDGLQVWASRSKDGLIMVSILTQDNGHAGSHGYLYAEAPPQKVGNDPYHPWDVPGRLNDVEDKVSENWWRVYNGLD